MRPAVAAVWFSEAAVGSHAHGPPRQTRHILKHAEDATKAQLVRVKTPSLALNPKPYALDTKAQLMRVQAPFQARIDHPNLQQMFAFRYMSFMFLPLCLFVLFPRLDWHGNV